MVLGSLAASCNLNKMPEFNDNDAFVAFSNAEMKIAEDGGSIKIPVHLTSLKDVATTVTYEFINDSASQGVDFEEASGSGTITFAAEDNEKFITVKILPHLGVFTGDRSFSVKFKSAGDVKMGANNTCTVTITDIDHPLSALFGTYTGTAKSEWKGDYSWEVTISKDETDVSKIWLSDPDPYFASYNYSSKIYGIVNSDMTEIVFPKLQSHVESYETAIVGFDTVDPYDATADADIVATIAPDGTITFPNGWGVYFVGDGPDLTLDIDDMYYAIYYGGTTFKKK